MKFLVDECLDCGLDLTAVEPAEVTCFADTVSGTCPGCSRSYLMVEVTPEELRALQPEPTAVEPEPTPARGRRGRREEPPPEPTPGSESEVAAEAESEPPELVTEGEPEAAPE